MPSKSIKLVRDEMPKVRGQEVSGVRDWLTGPVRRRFPMRVVHKSAVSISPLAGWVFFPANFFIWWKIPLCCYRGTTTVDAVYNTQKGEITHTLLACKAAHHRLQRKRTETAGHFPCKYANVFFLAHGLFS